VIPTAALTTPISSTQPGSSTFSRKIGIFYLLWHCPNSSSTTFNPTQYINDISLELQGITPWGAPGTWHWWAKPDSGYYCLAENDALLTKHAEMLRDAGIDFVYVDSTNHEFTDSRQ